MWPVQPGLIVDNKDNKDKVWERGCCIVTQVHFSTFCLPTTLILSIHMYSFFLHNKKAHTIFQTDKMAVRLSNYNLSIGTIKFRKGYAKLTLFYMSHLYANCA